MNSGCNTKIKISSTAEENLKLSVSSGKLSTYAGEYPFNSISSILVTTEGGILIAGEKGRYSSILMIRPDHKEQELRITKTRWIEDMTWVKADQIFAYIDQGSWIYSTVRLLKIDEKTRMVSEVTKFSTDVYCKALAYLDSHFFLLFPKSMYIKIVTIQGDIKYVISPCANCGWGKMALPAFEGSLFIDHDYKLYVFCSYTMFIFPLNKDSMKLKPHTAMKTSYLDRILGYDETRFLLASQYSDNLRIVTRETLDVEGTCRLDLSQEIYYPKVLCLRENELLVAKRSESGGTSELKVYQIDFTAPNNE